MAAASPTQNRMVIFIQVASSFSNHGLTQTWTKWFAFFCSCPHNLKKGHVSMINFRLSAWGNSNVSNLFSLALKADCEVARNFKHGLLLCCCDNRKKLRQRSWYSKQKQAWYCILPQQSWWILQRNKSTCLEQFILFFFSKEGQNTQNQNMFHLKQTRSLVMIGLMQL